MTTLQVCWVHAIVDSLSGLNRCKVLIKLCIAQVRCRIKLPIFADSKAELIRLDWNLIALNLAAKRSFLFFKLFPNEAIMSFSHTRVMHLANRFFYAFLMSEKRFWLFTCKLCRFWVNFSDSIKSLLLSRWVQKHRRGVVFGNFESVIEEVID